MVSFGPEIEADLSKAPQIEARRWQLTQQRLEIKGPRHATALMTSGHSRGVGRE